MASMCPYAVARSPGKVASNIRILDERTEDGVLNIHVTGAVKLDVTSVPEIMGYVCMPISHYFALLC